MAKISFLMLRNQWMAQITILDKYLHILTILYGEKKVLTLAIIGRRRQGQEDAIAKETFSYDEHLKS